MELYPHVTVAAVIEENQRFLLVEEYGPNTVVFNQPAGHWEKDETLIEAVSREVLEESAWQFVPEGLVGVYTYTSSQNGAVYLRFCFYGKHHSHEENRELDTGIIRTVWLSRKEIAQNNRLRSPLVLACVDDYLKGFRYPLDIIHSL